MCIRDSGKRHRNEFTMLEWYRIGWDYKKLLDETLLLLSEVLVTQTFEQMTYRDAFKQCFGLDLQACHDDELQNLATDKGLVEDKGRYSTLDFLYACMIEHRGVANNLYAIYDFPTEQASFAKLGTNGYAKRFEVFYGELELANGYQEITDATEYLQRVDHNNHIREQQGLASAQVNGDFLSGIKAQLLPECSGVSVGIERLLMCVLKTDDIKTVLVTD